jgi:nitrile hydratase
MKTIQAVTPDTKVDALESLLSDKAMLEPGGVDSFLDKVHDNWVPDNGAKIVARAWTDPEFKARLLADGRQAALEMGFPMPTHHRSLVVLENAADLHNVICCTLCSCTAFTIIGLAPRWYKDLDYRARVVRQSRTVLRELGLDLPAEMEVRVWDTTADTRFMVLPFRPAFTAGWSAARLAALVTQDAMIGVSRLEPPFNAAPA